MYRALPSSSPACTKEAVGRGRRSDYELRGSIKDEPSSWHHWRYSRNVHAFLPPLSKTKRRRRPSGGELCSIASKRRIGARGRRRWRRLASSKPARQQHTAAALLPNGRGSKKIRVPSIRIKRGCNVMSADVGSEDTDGLPAAAAAAPGGHKQTADEM